MIINDYATLVSVIEDRVSKVVQKKVLPDVIGEIIEQAESNVYSYKPAPPKRNGYKRRYSLKKKQNYKIVSDRKLSSTSTVDSIIFGGTYNTPLGKDKGSAHNPFFEWIEKGCVPNIFNNNEYDWMKPRPFAEKVFTEDNVKVKLIQSLKGEGYHVSVR